METSDSIKMHTTNYSEITRNLLFDCISKKCHNGDISESSIALYEKITEYHIFRGQIRMGIVIACIYKTYQIKNDYKTIVYIADLFNASERLIFQCVKILEEIINDKQIPIADVRR